ncbi:stage VI sporulation protein D [Geobacillus sp. C56-T2]|uniref:stage VI sporulation protein D n=1 Tax=Geobacillus sp. C56-T2 TaxID=600773 RepID=UPI00119D650E|nr:stage VI sporulation protein D [Geobacillus sp. C56-T2]NNV05539.1 stage VI sporulation protein D [Geobacillus sp. MMMUD3]TWG31404.1 stage VI sporulation protein D [Geobacillus sp. C56-T2]
MEQSYLRFSLEESVWFQSGQEVAEFLSISLDPVISVEEYDQYITIRGALELSGEFRSAQPKLAAAEEEDAFDLASYRFIQHIAVRDDGISELSHRFPIDITIPKNRIRSLDDVYVTVESFDYELGDNGRLVVTADISISGISDAPLASELPADEEEEPLFAPFESVARKEAADDEAFTSENQPASEAGEQPVAAVSEAPPSTVEPAAVRHEETLSDETEDVKEPFLPLETETKAVNAEGEEKIDSVLPPTEAKVSIGAAKKAVSEEDEEEQQAEVKSENALYLTKLFAKSEAEEFTTVKICIVQQGDSLDKIAERYEVTVSQLLRANDLESPDDVHEGQLLYIPAMAGSRSFS